MIFDIILVILGLLAFLFMWIDNQHFQIYYNVILLMVFLSFLFKAIYYFKIRKVKDGILFLVVAVLSGTLLFLNTVVL